MKTYNEIVTVPYGANGINLQFFNKEARVSCFPNHWHDRLEILHIISGSLQLSIDGEHMIAFPGQTVVITPFANHSGVSGDDGVRYYAITFDIQKYLNESPASLKYLTPLMKQKVVFRPITEEPAVTRTTLDLIDFLNLGDTLNPLCSMGKMYELIGHLYQYCFRDAKASQKSGGKFITVLEYMNNHFTENISTKSISQQFGYDETYFCRRFKSLTGITPMKHIRNLRIEMAQNLLANSNEEIKNIAWKCGFSDTAYFSNCFKQAYKMSPAEYRRHAKH